MRALFEIDTKDYDPKGPAFVRPSVRGIILRDGKVAMVHSIKYDYYKFPGGGIESGETKPQALIREVAEESGLQVLPKSIREYGLVHRVQKSDWPGIAFFVQDNYYYLCDVQPEVQSQHLDDYEAEEHFTLDGGTGGQGAGNPDAGRVFGHRVKWIRKNKQKRLPRGPFGLRGSCLSCQALLAWI